MARLLLILAACRCGAAEPPVAPPVTTPLPSPSPAVVPFACEGSALLWSGDRFLVGDNETKDRLYGMGADGAFRDPLLLGGSVDDVEAVAATAHGAWVVGSQGRKNSGDADPERQRIVHAPDGLTVVPDLSGCAPCTAAAALPPEGGGVNVEGAFTSGGHLWLGLRSPLVDRKALLVELDLPADPTSAAGRSPTVLRVIPIDLGGFAVRDVTPAPAGGFYVLAGPSDGARQPPRLYFLAAPDAAPTLLPTVLPPGTEGIAVTPDGTLAWVTDGDGKAGRCTVPSTWGRVSLPAPAGR